MISVRYISLSNEYEFVEFSIRICRMNQEDYKILLERDVFDVVY